MQDTEHPRVDSDNIFSIVIKCTPDQESAMQVIGYELFKYNADADSGASGAIFLSDAWHTSIVPTVEVVKFAAFFKPKDKNLVTQTRVERRRHEDDYKKAAAAAAAAAARAARAAAVAAAAAAAAAKRESAAAPEASAAAAAAAAEGAAAAAEEAEAAAAAVEKKKHVMDAVQALEAAEAAQAAAAIEAAKAAKAAAAVRQAAEAAAAEAAAAEAAAAVAAAEAAAAEAEAAAAEEAQAVEAARQAAAEVAAEARAAAEAEAAAAQEARAEAARQAAAAEAEAARQADEVPPTQPCTPYTSSASTSRSNSPISGAPAPEEGLHPGGGGEAAEGAAGGGQASVEEPVSEEEHNPRPPLNDMTFIRHDALSGYYLRKSRHDHTNEWFFRADELPGIYHSCMDEARRTRAVVPFVQGGAITVSRKRLRELGLPIVKNYGDDLRHCAAHAAFLLTRTVLPNLRGLGTTEKWFVDEVGGTLDEADDPTVVDIERAIRKHGLRLVVQESLSPHWLIQRGDGVFLVHFTATVGGDPVKHFMVYDKARGILRDPLISEGMEVVDRERCLNAGKSLNARKRAKMAALAVFHQAYDGVDNGSINITRIWQAVDGVEKSRM